MNRRASNAEESHSHAEIVWLLSGCSFVEPLIRNVFTSSQLFTCNRLDAQQGERVE